MNRPYAEKLKDSVAQSRSCLCVGLDPYLDRIPDSIKDQTSDPSQQVDIFLKRVIELTSDYCCAYKPNLAFFEALGPSGLQVFQIILDHIPDDKIVIADAKRGDIDSTAEYYRKAFFEQFEVDAVTLNPLMGFDTITPFAGFPEKGIYILTLTSNPGSSDILLKPVSQFETLSEYIASSLNGLSDEMDTHLGMVIGATQSEQIAKIIRHHPAASLLIPGIGTQGGTIRELVELLKTHKGIPLISSSRSILYPGTGKDWEEAIKKQAANYKDKLSPITDKYV